LKFSWSEPGVLLSSAAHAALLISMLVAFSNANRFDDAQETIPVDTITDAQFNQIMKGEKAAKTANAEPHPVADKVAEAEVPKPTPPTPQAKVDVPTPPPPLKRLPDPGEDDPPEATKPPPAPTVAVPPPQPPEPVKPELLKPEPKPQPPAPTTTATAPQPPPLPPQRPNAETAETSAAEQPKKPAEAKPVPTPPVKPPEKKDEAKARTDAKPRLDQVAKLLEEKRLEELASAEDKPVKPVPKPPSKPKSGDEESKPVRKFDSKQIEKLLSHEDPQSTSSTSRQLNKVASLGSPTGTAPKMTPTILMQLEGILQDQYKQCWSYLALAGQQKYYPMVQVTYNSDGSLGTEPSLVNPPPDPSLRSLADSAVRAVKKCNPLRIPAAFTPYFEQWRREPRILKFDPEEMSG
jgi:colicin import membrane protein